MQFYRCPEVVLYLILVNAHFSDLQLDHQELCCFSGLSLPL